jgi:hypothetical protein
MSRAVNILALLLAISGELAYGQASLTKEYIYLDGKLIATVNQGSCTYSISPTSNSVGIAGGSGTVGVACVSSCSWTANSNNSWITVTGGANGSGSGTFSYSVAANSGQARSGTITIAGQTFTVNQASGCTYSISPTSNSVGIAGGSGTVGVACGSSCLWTANSNNSWITVTGGANGSGSGTVSYSVAANSGQARSGTITIAGQTFTVNQASSCTYSISPMSDSFGSAGGSGSISVACGSNCPWTANSNDSWITVAGGASGPGTVSYSVAANSGQARSGTITIADQTFTVNQASGCTYSISPTSDSFGSAGGSGSISVACGSNCPWTASSNDSWITVAGGASGPGTVSYSVAANSGQARSGTIMIGDQPFSVNQEGVCTYTPSPLEIPVQAAGESSSFNLSTSGSSCNWWEEPYNSPWLTTSPRSGAGNATIGYTAEANNTGASRTGYVWVQGIWVTFTQPSTPCTSTVSPQEISVPAAGGSGNFNLSSSGPMCPYWEEPYNSPWLTTSPRSGAGSATISYTAEANNTEASRTGYVWANGIWVTFTQPTNCTYSISPTGASFGSNGGSGAISVTTAAACSWTASASDWLSITEGASGTGNGTITYSVAQNYSSSGRGSYINITGTTGFFVDQAGAPQCDETCFYYCMFYTGGNYPYCAAACGCQ